MKHIDFHGHIPSNYIPSLTSWAPPQVWHSPVCLQHPWPIKGCCFFATWTELQKYNCTPPKCLTASFPLKNGGTGRRHAFPIRVLVAFQGRTVKLQVGKIANSYFLNRATPCCTLYTSISPPALCSSRCGLASWLTKRGLQLYIPVIPSV